MEIIAFGLHFMHENCFTKIDFQEKLEKSLCLFKEKNILLLKLIGTIYY